MGLFQAMKHNHKKVGIICGCFDLLHAGYIRMFKDAKDNACNFLLIALQTDPTIDRPEKNKVVQSIQDRIEILEAIKYVDEVVVYESESDLYELLKHIEYDVRILGTDYRNKDYTGKDIDPSVYFHVRDHDISTTQVKNKIYESMKLKEVSQ